MSVIYFGLVELANVILVAKDHNPVWPEVLTVECAKGLSLLSRSNTAAFNERYEGRHGGFRKYVTADEIVEWVSEPGPGGERGEARETLFFLEMNMGGYESEHATNIIGIFREMCGFE